MVLSRFQNQRIYINDGQIIITLVEVRRNGQVRLGFEADENIKIHREETQIKIERERRNGDRS